MKYLTWILAVLFIAGALLLWRVPVPEQPH